MEHHSAKSITELLPICLREMGLEQTIMEHRIVALWPEVVGPMAAELTNRLEVKDRVLMVYLRSAALKSELFQCRFDLVKRLNEAVGGNVISDIRLLG